SARALVCILLSRGSHRGSTMGSPMSRDQAHLQVLDSFRSATLLCWKSLSRHAQESPLRARHLSWPPSPNHPRDFELRALQSYSSPRGKLKARCVGWWLPHRAGPTSFGSQVGSAQIVHRHPPLESIETRYPMTLHFPPGTPIATLELCSGD